MTIKSLNLEIINICNLKCKMCDIGDNKDFSYLSIKDIRKILLSKHINNKTDITITGGEPLLHKDIKKIFSLIYHLGYKISTLSTNGILTKKIINLLNFYNNKNISIPNIHISIDGNKKDHDYQRGIKGSFEKSIKTIILLKKHFKKIKIKIKYTITQNNINSIYYIYNLSKKLGTEISYKIIENDYNYTNKQKKPKLLNNLEKSIINNSLNKIYKNKNIYINNLINYLNNNTFNFYCNTPKYNIFILANGDIYGCIKYNPIGNINKDKIDDIIFNKVHINNIKYIKSINCKKCFSLHGAYKSLSIK